MRLNAADFENEPYENIVFTGDYIMGERARKFEDKQIISAFTVWQTLPLHTSKTPSWDKYIKSLGLTKGAPVSEDELKEAEALALANVDRILSKGKNNGGG